MSHGRSTWRDSRLSGLRRFVVISPHPDDAALSLGGSIARASRAAAEVTVLTVFGGDESDLQAAGAWDRQCGFGSAGAAARERRREEARACRALGARSMQLSFPDEQYAAERNPAVIWDAIQPALKETEAVLLPGWPLLQSDHRWLTRLTLDHLPPGVAVGLYVEQPYAMWETVGAPKLRSRMRHRIGQALHFPAATARQQPGIVAELAELGPIRWEVASLGSRALAAKARGIRVYESQLRGFGSMFVTQVLLHAWADGGEPIGWVL